MSTSAGVQLNQHTDILHGHTMQKCINACSILHIPWDTFSDFMMMYINAEPGKGTTLELEFTIILEDMTNGDMQ